MLYNIFNVYDEDGGFGDAVESSDLIATVEATPEEMEAFIKEWNHPRIYSRPYCDLYEHTIIAKPVKLTKLSEVIPYNPEAKDMPDLPKIPEGTPLGTNWYYIPEEKKFVLMTHEEYWKTHKQDLMRVLK